MEEEPNPDNERQKALELEAKKKARFKKYFMYIVIIWAIALMIVAILMWTSPRTQICSNSPNLNLYSNSTCKNNTSLGSLLDPANKSSR